MRAEVLRGTWGSLNFFVGALGIFPKSVLFAGEMERAGVTHVHAHFGTNSAEVVMLAPVLGGPPYSFTVHGPREFDKPQALGIAEKMRRAAFVVAISSYGRSQLYRWVEHQHWPKIRVIHCGLDPAFHEGIVVPAPVTPRLVCVGRLVEQKGQLLLIAAADRLAREGQNVGDETEHFRFNTAIAAMMEMLNSLKDLSSCSKEIQLYALQRLAIILSPLAPHLGEECWSLLGNHFINF